MIGCKINIEKQIKQIMIKLPMRLTDKSFYLC